MEQRRALYSFQGEGDTEMTMQEGDIITVTNKDVGEGWWEGYMANGAQGLFPIEYTEAYDVRMFCLYFYYKFLYKYIKNLFKSIDFNDFFCANM